MNRTLKSFYCYTEKINGWVLYFLGAYQIFLSLVKASVSNNGGGGPSYDAEQKSSLRLGMYQLTASGNSSCC